jgi:hypothetical protein
LTQGKCKYTGNCDFEDGWCNFKNTSLANKFNWTIGSILTVPIGMGPTVDHVILKNH